MRGGPNVVDRHVGARLREMRVERGVSQERLASASGISFQQVQKYERGANRVSAGRLYEFATLLGVEVGAFFAGVPKLKRRRAA